MTKSLSLVLILLFSISLYSQAPNIIVIIADDYGIDADNGFILGTRKPNTPHIDSLRNAGLSFTQAWSYPVCTPTRAAIMSGKYGSKTGVKTAPGNLDTSEISIFKALKNSSANYSTAAIGKWHVAKPVIEQHPNWHGVDHYTGILGASWPAYDNWSKTENGVTTTSTDYATSYFTDDAISWIRTQNASKPFFLWLAHIAPHTPFHVPPAHMYTRTNTTGRLNRYLAMIESLDYEVGRLLDSMTTIQKANTIIIFIGDNGTPNNTLQGYPANHGKESLYQGGVHVPMFVSGKGVTRKGKTESALVNVLDIYATAIELGGENLPGGKFNSLSFLPLLSNSSMHSRQYNFSELDTNQNDITTQGFTIRDSAYKLIEYFDSRQEFFNLTIDPLEQNNLVLAGLSNYEFELIKNLRKEAIIRITDWSCDDNIQNGDETGIDSGGSVCTIFLDDAIQEITLNRQFEIFPNPASSVITISSDLKEINQITIYNIQGVTIASIKIDKLKKYRIDINELKKGTYILEINNSERHNILVLD